jgi:LacI family transcriptional regulator
MFEAVEKYGYKRRKTSGKSVAFIIDEESFRLSSSFYSPIIAGIEEELNKFKYYFRFHSVQKQKFDLSRINVNFNDLAGVIMVGVYHDDFVLKLKNIGIPLVLLDYYIPTEKIKAILIDNTDGILTACKYLKSLGHRAVAFIGGDSVETAAEERFYGYLRGVELYGFVRDPSLVVKDCKSRIDEGFRAANIILDSSANPTAILTYNDLIAVGAMDAIKQRGLSIPRDMSIIGFDDIHIASEVNPPLTTSKVPKQDMGRQAVKHLMNCIKGKDDLAHKVLMATELVIRGSTSPPRSNK